MNKIFYLILLSHILCFIAGCCFVLLFKTFIDDKNERYEKKNS
jgi:hypothetical protein